MNTPRQNCGCDSREACKSELPRRDFLKLAGLGAVAASTLDLPAMAGPFSENDFHRIIPVDKKLHPDWVKSLFARGEPQRYSGNDLRFIGMPVGGIFCGTLYLGGDGKLWLWDIFNHQHEGIVPKTVKYLGQDVPSRNGSAYVEPSEQIEPLAQEFAILVNGQKHPLDRRGFKNITFTGQYPIGTVTYHDPAVPLDITLEAFSPFIPLDADDSGLPVTVMSYTVKNTGDAVVEATLVGSLENAVCLFHRNELGTRVNQIVGGEGFTFLDCSVKSTVVKSPENRANIGLEDWNKDTYEGWTVEGTAFGTGPIKRSAIPSYQGEVGGEGERVVNSHASAPGNDINAKDAHTGKLTCKTFTIERNYLVFWIGGGAHKDKTCLNLKVDGKIVRSTTGGNDNRMAQKSFDVRDFQGKQAIIEIVDEEKGGWGNIGVGRIVQSDQPAMSVKLDDLHDFGTMGLALLGKPADVVDAGTHEPKSTSSLVSLDQKLIGELGRKLHLAPGESATVNFVVAWHFPNYELGGLGKVGRYYAAKFDSALAVAKYVAKNFERLASQTKLWRDTWYDSTLPYWFLDRTFANTSILATTTCYRHKNGRFWAWEGIGCCPGTCTHVWHYAQAMGRVFPEIERDQRERVDFGIALAPDGTIRFRAESGDVYAVDGQAGTILRAYREHQMSADDAFLRRIWPGVKKAMQKIIATDGNADGLIVGPLHNTLDADWHGLVPWLAGLYHAALRATEEMATEMGETDFARQCHTIFEVGQKNLDAHCWRESFGYYVQEPDPKAGRSIGVYDGCHIDQVLGPCWARQVGLGDVMQPAHVKRTLQSLWDFNFTPDVGPFREVEKAGRWYAMPGDGGLIMVSYPFTKVDNIIGRDHWAFMYFNECMSGFEHQAASHMMWEGFTTEALAVTRAIHDRYSAKLRNPYNEVECSDHYARAMASYGTFLAACGFEYHGPKGHLAFMPRLTPDNFRAAFTAAEGWGTLGQKDENGKRTAEILVKYGRLRLRTLTFALPEKMTPHSVTVTMDGKPVDAKHRIENGRVNITLSAEAILQAKHRLSVTIG